NKSAARSAIFYYIIDCYLWSEICPNTTSPAWKLRIFLAVEGTQIYVEMLNMRHKCCAHNKRHMHHKRPHHKCHMHHKCLTQHRCRMHRKRHKCHMRYKRNMGHKRLTRSDSAIGNIMPGSAIAKANHGSTSGPTRNLVTILIVLFHACVSKASRFNEIVNGFCNDIIHGTEKRVCESCLAVIKGEVLQFFFYFAPI
uniref:Uncharacterized protein n=1 Tax=Romanomermis culicivorax TaxID=13658 RepID=A0A915I1T9_ROMCU